MIPAVTTGISEHSLPGAGADQELVMLYAMPSMPLDLGHPCSFTTNLLVRRDLRKPPPVSDKAQAPRGEGGGQELGASQAQAADREPWRLLNSTRHILATLLVLSERTQLKESPGHPWWCSGLKCTCQCRRHGFNLWSGKIPHAMERLSPRTTAEPVLPQQEKPPQ